MAELIMERQAVVPSGAREVDENGEPKGPLRRCVVTRSVLPKERLLRFVVGPDASLVIDLEGDLPGRGIWLQARRNVVETACAKGSFAKAARQPVTVPEGLPDRVAALARRRCLDLVGLARRAGQVASGFEQVRAMLRDGRAGALLAAVDGSEGGRGKMTGLARDVPLVELFTALELGAALGREQAVHVALARGKLAQRLVAEAQRLAGVAGTGKVTIPSAEQAAADSA
jgi:uncharacterized protein